MRRFLSTALFAAAIITQAAPAFAGDTRLAPSWVRVDAGEQIELSASVFGDAAGWITEAPFYAYLHGKDYGTIVTTAPGGAATDVLVGELTVDVSRASAHLAVLVSIPEETPPGEYQIVICNDPCTTGIGDLIGGPLYVGVDPPASDAEAAPASPAVAVDVLATSIPPGSRTDTTYLALGQQPERTTQVSPLWIAFSAALGAAVLVTALAGRNRG